MLTFNTRIDKPRLDESLCQRQLERAAKAIARLTATQASQQIPAKFHLKRSWVAKGMRYASGASSPSEATAYAFHKDSLMRKHEGSSLSGHLATPTEYARSRFNDRMRRPKYLLNLNGVFVDPRGDIYKREKHSKRRLFFFSRTHRYVDRLNLLEIASNVD